MVTSTPLFNFATMFCENRLLNKVPSPAEIIDHLGSQLPHKSRAESVNVENKPGGLDAIQNAREMVVMADANDPKSILEHPILGPLLSPYARVLFAERKSPSTGKYETSLANEKHSISVQGMPGVGSLEVIHVITGVDLYEDPDGTEFNVPIKVRNSTAALRNVLDDLNHAGDDSIAIFLDGAILRSGNASHAIRAYARGLGNNTYDPGLYKSDSSERSIDGKLSQVEEEQLAAAKAAGWQIPEGTNDNPEAEYLALCDAIENGYQLPPVEEASRTTRHAIKNVFFINNLEDDEAIDKEHMIISSFEEGDMLSRVQSMCKFLAECPHDILNCEVFVRVLHKLNESVKEMGANTEIEIYGPKMPGLKIDGTLTKFKMAMLLAVHEGSPEIGPFVVRLKYRHPQAEGRKVTVLSSKCLMHDDGGAVGKHEHGEGMKGDMTAGASIAAEFARFGEEKPIGNYDFLFGIATNSGDGKARKMDDIFRHASGVTSEELNTDAEGRQVLGDVEWFAMRVLAAEGQKIEAMIDVATLTGAALIIGGYRNLVISNDKHILRQLEDIGIANGDRVQPEFMTAEDKRAMMDTQLADYKNVDNRKQRGAQQGGAYIKGVAGISKIPYVHFDIARSTSYHKEGSPKDLRGQFPCDGYSATLHELLILMGKKSAGKVRAHNWSI